MINLNNYIIEAWNGVKKQSNIENIKSWCEEMGIESYTINSQGEIDVNGNVYLNYKYFKELPYKFGKVNGFFNMNRNENLTSLKNCPDYVSLSFSCDKCPQLDSLEGCPKEVGSKFFCRFCKCDFLEEEVISLCKVRGEIVTNGYNDYELY